MPKGGNSGGGGGGKGKPGGGDDDGGINQINGNKRDNTLIGTDGNDAILGKDGNDTLVGLGGDDFLSGGSGDDWLYGDDPDDDTVSGSDRLFGSSGDDHLFGGPGDDELQGGSGIDELDGGDGYDIAYFMETPEGITVTASEIDNGYIIDFDSGYQEIAKNIEAIAATNYDDIMIGFDDRDDWFDGVGGDDLIYGNGGNDTINGGAGNDTIYGGDGDDLLYGGSGDDMIAPGAGSDVVDGGSNAWWEAPDHDVVTYEGEDGGGGSGLTLTAAFVPASDPDISTIFYVYYVDIGDDADFLWNVEEVRGTEFDDTMTGDVTGGDDHFVGGGGSDTLDGQGGNDTASYVGSDVGVTVDLNLVGVAQVSLGDASGDMLTSIENLIGSAHDDTLTGDGGDNVIEGGAGNDDMTGGAGADTFVFLRNATDDGDPDPIFGHGNDVIWDYDPLEDELHFLTNEAFVLQLSDDGTNTTVTYADDSSIVLMNIMIDDLLDLNATVIVDPDLFTV